jgi:hypothetical protein
MRTFFGLWILFAGLCAPSLCKAGGQQKLSLPGAPGSVGEEERRFKEALDRLGKDYEAELALRTRLRTQGAMSEADVDEARLGLARVRINQALTEKKAEEVREQHNTVIKIRDRELARMQALQRMSSVSLYELLASQRRLAYARFLLARQEGRSDDAVRELREIVRTCEAELKAMSDLRGISGAELEWARLLRTYARYCLARQEGKSDDAVRELRTTVEVGEAMLDRLTKLHRGSTLPLEEEFNRLLVEFARHRLARAEQKPEEVRSHLREAVKLQEAIETRLRADPASVSKLQKAELDHNLALSRLRLAMAAAGLELSDDDPWNLLDH